MTPMAQALMGKRVGETAELGGETLTVRKITRWISR
jgi:transcription elongation GreA/GreB family factor